MLKKMEIKDFDQVYTLMEESFPKDEYRDYQKQKELFRNPEYQILIEKDPEFLGNKAFFAAWEFEIFYLRGTFRSQSGIEKWRRRKQDTKSIDRRRRKNDHSGSGTSDRKK